ncbi:MAG TPA: PQQ-binding-like beta-propeller repeat protein [Candidatus Baltobacteraceae bacterium]|nr:PQQ-binding-like beta-propeller repeat protein [Candidatus Baltobacteraceae bacterium]
MFRNDPAHNGVYASVAPRLTTVRWRFKTGGKIMSSPAFSDGVVYVGSFDQNLYAIDARSGARLWAFATKGPVNSSPAVSGGAVYFSSLDGNVYAVSAANGRERWHFKTLGERRFSAPGIHGMIPRTERMPDPFDVFLSSPVIANGTLYIGSGDSHIYALDAQTGALRWSFKTGNVVHATPAVAGETVYVGSWDRYFYALDARTGAVKWKFITGDDRDIYNQVGIAGSAAVSGDTVFFGCRDSFFYALNARTGTLRWKHNEHGSWVIGSPALANGNVYYTTSDERRFWALNAATGAELFSIPYQSASFSSPSIAGNMAYFGVFDGRLYGIDLKTGKIAAQFSTDGSRRNLSAHLNAKGEVEMQGFYRDNTFEGIVAGLDRVFSLGSIFGSPAIVNGILYIGSTDGTLYALQ